MYTSGSGSHLTSNNRQNQRRLASCGSTGDTASPAATQSFTLGPGAMFTVSCCERLAGLWLRCPSTQTAPPLMKTWRRRGK